MPSNWTPMDDSENVKIVTLQPSDQEYADVIKDFQTQMGANYNTILKVSCFFLGRGGGVYKTINLFKLAYCCLLKFHQKKHFINNSILQTKVFS